MVKHIHSIRRVRGTGIKGKPAQFRCLSPDCHFVSRPEHIEGKNNRCPVCGGIHMLTWADLQKQTPHCGCKSKTKLTVLDIQVDVYALRQESKNETE